MMQKKAPPVTGDCSKGFMFEMQLESHKLKMPFA